MFCDLRRKLHVLVKKPVGRVACESFATSFCEVGYIHYIAILLTPMTDAIAHARLLQATSGKDIIVKVHMDHTRALRMSSDTSLDDLLSAVCQKFRRDDGSLSLW